MAALLGAHVQLMRRIKVRSRFTPTFSSQGDTHPHGLSGRSWPVTTIRRALRLPSTCSGIFHGKVLTYPSIRPTVAGSHPMSSLPAQR